MSGDPDFHLYEYKCEDCGVQVITYRITDFRKFPPELVTPTQCYDCQRKHDKREKLVTYSWSPYDA